MRYYNRIRDLREDADLTQEQHIKKLGMHKTTYTNYEQGKHTVPFDFAVELAAFYNVSLDYIAGITNSKSVGAQRANQVNLCFDNNTLPLNREERQLIDSLTATAEVLFRAWLRLLPKSSPDC